jgi:hypothetical protein
MNFYYVSKKLVTLATAAMVTSLLFTLTLASCKVSYGFSEKTSSIPDTVKTVKIDLIANRAPYVNPQLSPALTDKFRQKVTNQTKLTLLNANADNAHWEIAGEIRDYSVSTTGVTSTNGQQQSSINRLTVSVHITINKRNKIDEYDVSRSFDFSARQSLQQAEATLLDEMVRNLTDEIFNKLFSDW